jgi:hypothetical protein
VYTGRPYETGRRHRKKERLWSYKENPKETNPRAYPGPMTRNEFGMVYVDIRPRVISTLTGRYHLVEEDAEDMVHDMAMGLLERPELLATMDRPQVEAWFQRKHAGPGQGLNWRVRDFQNSDRARRHRERKWGSLYQKSPIMGIQRQKDPEESIFLMREDFTEALGAYLDAEKAPPATPKRQYRRRHKAQLVTMG